jgi:hypothetical protein
MLLKTFIMRIWRLSLIILVVLISACTPAVPTPIPTLTPPPYSRTQYINDQNIKTPDFIAETHSGNFGPDAYYFACVTINHQPFWQVDDRAGDTHRMIQQSVVVWIDGQASLLAIKDVTMIGELALGQGSFGTTNVCARVLDASIGLHTAKIEFQTLRHQVLSYEWIFEVIE